MPVLVVVALPVEAAHLPGRHDVVLTGLGKTAAAVAVARALAERDRTGLEVVNLGTAGALRDGLAGIFEPSLVVNHDMNADAIRALGVDPGERVALAGGDGTVLASGDVFVADPVRRAELAVDAHLVDMEGFAVASACAAFGVPCRLVKHVSDQADEGALAWADLVDASAQALASWFAANYS